MVIMYNFKLHTLFEVANKIVVSSIATYVLGSFHFKFLLKIYDSSSNIIHEANEYFSI